MATGTNSLLSDEERKIVIEMRHAMHRERSFRTANWKTQQRQLGVSAALPFAVAGMRLSIREAREDLPYHSQVPGIMHACGHDMHSSIALGTAITLHCQRNTFSGRVRVFFSQQKRRIPSAVVPLSKKIWSKGSPRRLAFMSGRILLRAHMGHARASSTKSADQFELK